MKSNNAKSDRNSEASRKSGSPNDSVPRKSVAAKRRADKIVGSDAIDTTAPTPTVALHADAPTTQAADLSDEPRATDASIADQDANALPMTVLHEILQALARATPQQEILTLLAQRARTLTQADSAALVLLEADRETLHFVAVAGEVAANLRGTRARAENTFLGRTAQTGQPVLTFQTGDARLPLTNQTEGSSPQRDLSPAGMAPLSAAVVPIFGDGAPVGALAALDKAGQRPFSGDDLLSLTTIAAAATVALAEAQLREERERQARELSLLYEAVRIVSGKLSVQEILQSLVEQTGTQLDSGVVVVLLANDERTHLYVADEQGLDDEGRDMTFATGDGWGRAVLGATRPLFFSFYATGENKGEQEDRDGQSLSANIYVAQPQESPFPNLRARSGLAAPIRAGDKALGAVLALSQEPDAFRIADANLLSALAAHSAIALENAGLYEDAMRRGDEATALYELSQAVNSSLRLRDVLDRVADATLRLLDVDKFALFLREDIGGDAAPLAFPNSQRRYGGEDGRQRLRLEVQRGLTPDAAARLRPLVGEGVPGWVVQYETPASVQDLAADARNRTLPLHKEGVVSLVCMPLQIGGETLGALCALSAHRRLFTIGEAELLFTIANQVAIAIENARVYAEARRRGREMRRSFHRIARMLGSAQSPQETMPLIAQLAREMLNVDRCTLYDFAELGSRTTPLADDAEPPAPSLTITANAPVSMNESVPPDRNVPPQSAMTQWIARRRRPLRLENIAQDERFQIVEPTADGGQTKSKSTSAKSARAATAAAKRAHGSAATNDKDSSHHGAASEGAYLGVPLRQGRETVGVFEVYSRTPRIWRNEDLRLLLTFASQAVVAGRGLRLLKQERDATRRADALEELLQQVIAAKGSARPGDLLAKLNAIRGNETNIEPHAAQE